MSATELDKAPHPHAALDAAHIGDIRGALGTIRHCDIAPRNGWWARLRTLFAIVGPGLIVMVGDNDAGAFGTYTEEAVDGGLEFDIRSEHAPLEPPGQPREQRLDRIELEARFRVK